MKFSEARAVCADLLWRENDVNLYEKLQAEIVQRLVLASPQVSSIGNGIFLLDATGLTHLGGENKFCKHIQKLLNTTGFNELHIGIADSAFAAQVASKFKRSRHYIVPPGKDKEFLSPLSIKHMPVPDEVQDTFARLGIKTIDQLLKIPVQEIQERFGAHGLAAVKLASGIDQTHPELIRSPQLFECSVDLNFPVESLSQTQFILKSMLERICSELKEQSMLAEELLVSFFNDNEKFDERPLKLLRPSHNTKFLLEIAKLSLEATPLAREYTALHIKVVQSISENWQQTKLQVIKSGSQSQSKIALLGKAKEESTVSSEAAAKPANKSQQRSDKNDNTSFVAELKHNDAQAEPFALLLQRFITRFGSKSVVRPASADQHLPDLAANFLPLVEEGEAILPINIEYDSSYTGASAVACGLILKKSPSPEPVLVEYQGKTPTSITYQGRWHKIKELTEPERLSGLWWENPSRKSYYVALIEVSSERIRGSRLRKEGGQKYQQSIAYENYLVLLVHDHENNSWYLDGFFD